MRVSARPVTNVPRLVRAAAIFALAATAHASAQVNPIARYAGTWSGQTFSRGGNTLIVAWTWTQGSDSTGSFMFGDEMTASPTRILFASPDSVVAEMLWPLRFGAGHPLDGARQRVVGRTRGDSMGGMVHTRVVDGREGRRPFSSVRVGAGPVFEKADCMFTRGDWAGVARIDCGWLVVPERRHLPTGRTVRLAVAILRAARPAGKTPVVYLHGGPGIGGVNPVHGSLPAAVRGPLAQERDIVFYDQRASGYSQPRLCPEYDDSIAAARHRMTSTTADDIRRRFAVACLDALRAKGIDAEAYNTTASAQDLADLRRALGITRWDVNGDSYGTRLALEAMRADPNGIRGVILNAPVPPGWQQADRPLTSQRTLDRLFAACGRSAPCRQAFPTVQQDFNALYDELLAAPVRVAVSGSDSVELSAVRFISSIKALLSNTADLPRIPFLINELRRGDRARAAQTLVGRTPNSVTGPISRILNQLVICYEFDPVAFRRIADSANAIVRPAQRESVEAERCTLRKVFSRETDREPVRSDIPTLIFTGEFDVVTPPEHGPLIARTLAHAYVFELPARSHYGARPACMRDIMLRFLENPARAPDASCVKTMPGIQFVTSWNERTP